jgi:hypothetical protein
MSRQILFPRLAVLFVVGLFTVLYIWQPGGARQLTFFSDVVCILAAALAAILAFLAGSRFDRGVPQQRAWLLLGVGMALWTVAESLWMYFEVGLDVEVPYPSFADVIFAIGYIPLVLGLLIGYRGFGVRLPMPRRLIVALAYAVLLAALAYWFLRPMFFGPEAAGPVESFIDSYYLVGDLTLAFMATLSLIVVWNGLIGRPWVSILIGMLLFAVSDSAFSYTAWEGSYAVGGNWQSAVIDVAYFAAYLTVILGAYRQAMLRLADVVRPGNVIGASPRPTAH